MGSCNTRMSGIVICVLVDPYPASSYAEYKVKKSCQLTTVSSLADMRVYHSYSSTKTRM